MTHNFLGSKHKHKWTFPIRKQANDYDSDDDYELQFCHNKNATVG